MLEKLRKQGASAIIYVLFGILIAGFVINFGPQSGGGSEGCGGASPDTVIEVDGVEQGKAAWQFVYNGLQRGARQQRAEATMEILLRREILAQEAERRGLRISDELVDHKLKSGELYLPPSQRIDVPAMCERGMMQVCYFNESDGQWFFDYPKLQNLVTGLSMSMPNFKGQQERELLADMMADILRGSATASKEEALSRFVHQNTTVTFDAVQFDARSYEQALRLTPADVERFVAGHEAEIKAKFDAEAASYKGVPAQVHLRQIAVKRAAPAAAPAEPAPGQIATPPVADTGKADLEKARAEIVAGTKTFAAVASTLNDSEALRSMGGDLGWRAVDAPGLAAPALNDAVKALKAGEVSPVIETPSSYVLLTIEGAERKGDLTYDQVKAELALQLARTTWGKEAAKRAALEALAKAREAKGQNLDALFPRGAPKLTPEQMQQIQFRGGETGSVVWESQDVPAEWNDEGAGSAAGGAVAQAPAAAPAPTAAPAAEAPAAAPAAGAPAVPAPAAAPAAAVPVTASADVLPAMGEVAKPTTEKVGPINRDREEIATLGKSPTLIKALFDELSAGMLGPTVYEVDGSYVLVQVTEKKTADVAEFEKDPAQRVEWLQRERGEALLQQWVADRCQALVKDGKVSFNKDRVQDHDEKGNALPITYQPCSLLAQ